MYVAIIHIDKSSHVLITAWTIFIPLYYAYAYIYVDSYVATTNHHTYLMSL